MKKESLKKYIFGDMCLEYIKGEDGTVGAVIYPLKRDGGIIYDKRCAVEPLVQLRLKDDISPNGFTNGHSMRYSGSTRALRYVEQSVEKVGNATHVTTLLRIEEKAEVQSIITYLDNTKAFISKNIIKNISGSTLTVEMLSSFAMGGITYFDAADCPEGLIIHRARSSWSAEGRIESSSAEDMQLEPSWSHCGVRVERFGQVGSMPVRQFFPFVAVENTAQNITWAAQIACNSSWQMELYRRDEDLSLSGGPGDFEFAHWTRDVAPLEDFETPEAFVSVSDAGLDDVCQRLLTIQKARFKAINKFDTLPLLFNEFCTTWGTPSAENIKNITRAISNHGFDYFVIDAGWYATDKGWWQVGGDWDICEKLFPNGLEETVRDIESASMKAGIWFEPETCATASNISQNEAMLLKRGGSVISTGGRKFLDMRKPTVAAYLDEKVIGLLNKYGFKYIKIDYNDTIGVGCDGAESIGEGLRANMQASRDFFRRIREKVSDIVIENCSSGGHRLEPSMMEISDMASFSDAHECVSIPIIAANLHRLILPEQSQIWAVIRDKDDKRRLNYSLVNTFLGVMCISGDVLNLSGEKWAQIDEAVAFYKSISHITQNGISSFFGTEIKSYNHPKGWQAVVRRDEASGETLVVVHTFGGEYPEEIALPVKAKEICGVICSEGNAVTLCTGTLTIALKADFEAVAVHLK